MFGNIGAGEMILIVLVILIFFGPKKIPEIAQGIGKGMREFKKAMKDVEEEIKVSDNKPSQPKAIEANNTTNNNIGAPAVSPDLNNTEVKS